MKYKYIHFVKIRIREKPETSVWSCRNNKTGNRLGFVEWYPPWRQYCFSPTCDAIYSTSCLKDIIDFIEGLKK